LTSTRPPADPADETGRGRIATVRNVLIRDFLRPRHRFVFWLDADLVSVPSDLVARLHAACEREALRPGSPLLRAVGESGGALPAGKGLCVAAPLVLLDSHARVGATREGMAGLAGETGGVSRQTALGPAASPKASPETGNGALGLGGLAPSLRFYDTAAFVQEGERAQTTSPPGQAPCGHRNYGSVRALPPYFNLSAPSARPIALAAPNPAVGSRVGGQSGGQGGGQGGVRRVVAEPLRPGGLRGAPSPPPPLPPPPPSRATVRCDCVGTTYLLPADVYRWGADQAGQGGLIRHYAHLLTEHCPVTHAAKYLLGLEVRRTRNR